MVRVIVRAQDQGLLTKGLKKWQEYQQMTNADSAMHLWKV